MKIFAVALLAGITFLTACSADGDKAPSTTEPPISFSDPEDKNETQSSTSTTISNEIITTTTLGLTPELGPPTSPFEAAEILLSQHAIQSELPDTFTPELDVQYNNAAQYASIEWPGDSEKITERLNALGFEWLADRRVKNGNGDLFALQILKFAEPEGAQKWVEEGFGFKLGEGTTATGILQRPREQIVVPGADTARFEHTTWTFNNGSDSSSLHSYGVMSTKDNYVVNGFWIGKNPSDLQAEAINLIVQQLEGIV